jgi:hypothetical protein
VGSAADHIKVAVGNGIKTAGINGDPHGRGVRAWVRVGRLGVPAFWLGGPPVL